MLVPISSMASLLAGDVVSGGRGDSSRSSLSGSSSPSKRIRTFFFLSGVGGLGGESFSAAWTGVRFSIFSLSFCSWSFFVDVIKVLKNPSFGGALGGGEGYSSSSLEESESIPGGPNMLHRLAVTLSLTPNKRGYLSWQERRWFHKGQV